MLKKWTLGLILLSTSLFTQATLITKDVNAVDMAGISVTAFFEGGTQETLIWSALTATIGGVENNDWSLKLEGNTFGDFDQSTNTFHGEWNLINNSSTKNIVGLSIDASLAGFYFDIINGANAFDVVSGDFTAGSGPGRSFFGFNQAGEDLTVSASFTNMFSGPDLFGQLNLAWEPSQKLELGETFSFLTDTDKATVPEPSTLFTFALGLIALTSLRKKSSGK
ncbi:PEP-CTERM sorting domain-containing protein [Colwellia sp. MSW7]|uniref:PEP-CTERM sorting domain-containing protein n=1 Tax=Colwellia maritima TaxID=2912588 RepID=A0ABS9X7J6_9GAMM|nr:PEP-CTERM sorting domain-containing protein [Colwellia maritima]MCI2285461.1 PEP-CTERM sorting domain-containing protein [Colwellia maritima]